MSPATNTPDEDAPVEVFAEFEAELDAHIAEWSAEVKAHVLEFEKSEDADA